VRGVFGFFSPQSESPSGQEHRDGQPTRHRGGKNQAHGVIMESTNITTRVKK
jgi:hypothetical protein